MRTLFISDCHLTPDKPEIIEGFRRFINREASSADELYILGDLFEYWIGDDHLDDAVLQVLNDLRAASDQLPIYFLHGNRDFLIGNDFAKKTGCQILNAPVVIDLHGTPTLIMHGDELCSDDRAHQIYRVISRHPVTRAIWNHMSYRWRLRIANRIRRQSKRNMQRKSLEIMDVNRETVVRVMQQFSVTQLIHGHTHRPAVHQVELPNANVIGKRIVLGDWNQQADILSVEDGKLNLHSVNVTT